MNGYMLIDITTQALVRLKFACIVQLTANAAKTIKFSAGDVAGIAVDTVVGFVAGNLFEFSTHIGRTCFRTCDWFGQEITMTLSVHWQLVLLDA